MFEQYNAFFEIILFGVPLSVCVALLIRGLINGHFSHPIIEADPQPEAEIIILDEYRNNKKAYLKNGVVVDIKNNTDKKYVLIDKDYDLYKKNVS